MNSLHFPTPARNAAGDAVGQPVRNPGDDAAHGACVGAGRIAASSPAPLNILLIDDDVGMGRMLAEFLLDEQMQVRLLHDGLLAGAMLHERVFDLALLDVMLPGRDGFDILRELRGHADADDADNTRLPVIMLSARGNENDRILGLELGADDYLPKPFNPRELAARIRAVLRRGAGRAPAREARGAAADHLSLCDGALRYRPQTLEATLRGDTVRLTAAEGRILEILMRSAGRMIGREQLSQWALGRKLGAQDRSLDTHASNLRRKLGLVAPGPELRSVRGMGYMLVPHDDRATRTPGEGPRKLRQSASGATSPS